MRRIAAIVVPLAAATALAAAGTPRRADAPRTTSRTTAPARMPAVAELGRAEPGDALTAQRAGATGRIDRAAVSRSMAKADAIADATAAAAPAVANARWNLAGPTNIGGRVLDVAVDPTLPDTVYAAAASGGVWVSKDAGKTFASIWPPNLTQAIGALVISPTGVLYAGTGEAGPGGGSITYGGNGVYRSGDRGKTWQHIGLATSGRIGRIAIDPSDEKRVFVAATGDLYAAGGERGVYLSVNGGDTWEQVLAGDNDTTGAADLAIDPADPQRVFATMWDNHREPDRRFYTGVGSGIYLSTDSGATWVRTGLPYFAADPEMGRVGIAIAPSDPKRVYAITSTEVGAFAGFYASTDGGATFVPGAGVPLVTGAFVYGWWFGRLYVDPDEPAKVYVSGVNLSRTTDGGLNWGSVGGMHADHHGMAWDSKVEGRVYSGDDGGIWISEDDGGSWDKSEYQPWNQLYGLDVDESDADHLVAGLQDNGVNRNYRPDEDAGPGEWNSIVGGDGEKTLINPEDPAIVYGCYQYGECSVSHDYGDGMSSFAEQIVASRKNWFTPIEFDPLDPSIVYTGGESLWRSEDDGGSWTRIGGTTVDFSNGPGREPNPLFRNYGTITAIATTDRDTGVMMVGTDDGNLWISSDGGMSFTKVSDDALPSAWITRVATDLTDPSVLYVTYSGYREADQAAHVFRSADSGETWADISAGLPQAPVNDIIIVGSDLLVATDVGVYLTRDKGVTWLTVGTDLPRAPVNDIRYHAKSRRIYAATFGRGAYWTAYPTGTAVAPPPAPVPPAPAPPRPQPRPLPATGLPLALPLFALLATITAVTIRRRPERRM